MSGNDEDVRNAILAWVKSSPRVRRAWVLGNSAGEPRGPDAGVDVAIEIEPVADSEETAAVWMANADTWRSQLQQQVRPEARLHWFDPDGSTPGVKQLLDAKDLLYERSS